MSHESLRPDDTAPVYAISVAARIAGMHPQTLRQYDRLGLVSPDRTSGRNRLYSLRDIARLRQVAQLSGDGVNLAGIQRVLALQAQVDTLRAETDALRGRCLHRCRRVAPAPRRPRPPFPMTQP
jgi:MerR family transcriptional regulator/heat shock protein HspR